MHGNSIELYYSHVYSCDPLCLVRLESLPSLPSSICSIYVSGCVYHHPVILLLYAINVIHSWCSRLSLLRTIEQHGEELDVVDRQLWRKKAKEQKKSKGEERDIQPVAIGELLPSYVSIAIGDILISDLSLTLQDTDRQLWCKDRQTERHSKWWMSKAAINH